MLERSRMGDDRHRLRGQVYPGWAEGSCHAIEGSAEWRVMRRGSLCILTAALPVALLSTQALGQEDAALIKEAGAKYQKNCMGCHQPPDRRFATDRAWIGQIRETA